MNREDTLEHIQLQILWDRLLAVVEVGKAIANRPRRAMSLEVSHQSHKPSGGT